MKSIKDPINRKEQKQEKAIEIISIGEEEPVEKDIEIIKDEQVCGELLSVAAAINSLKFAIIKEFGKEQKKKHNNFRDELPKKTRKRKVW